MVYDLSSGTVPIPERTNIDVLLAGPPCQGFSTAGKRDFHDPRNNLLLVAGVIALKLMPRVFVAENVAAVISGPHRHYWDSLKGMLLQRGYKIEDLLCHGDRMGIPQIRRRRILLAWRTERENDITLPITNGGVLGDALTNIGVAGNHSLRFLASDSDSAIIANRIKPGQKLSNVRGGPTAVHTWDIPEVFGHTNAMERSFLETLMRARRRYRLRKNGDADPVSLETLEKEFRKPVKQVISRLMKIGYVRQINDSYDLTHAFNGKYRRLRSDKPSLTVDTRFGNPRYFLHPVENRGFTVRESARIQGFPDCFTFDGPDIIQYRLVGNAVPPPLAECLAHFTRNALL